MQSTAPTVEEYLKGLPEDRKAAMTKLQNTVAENLPGGFKEVMGYGMICYAVPHSVYPSGYHCNPKRPLPFISIASQKNFIALYHMGLYADERLLDWFREEYSKCSKTRLDMGKSCIRFKKLNEIPLALIAELASKITVKQWINCYERQLKKNR